MGKRKTKGRVRKRTKGGFAFVGTPWTATSWPQQYNGNYYPLDSYKYQMDRILHNTTGGTRKRRK